MNLNTIYKFAEQRHEGQFRRDGITPYFMHCIKVASLVESDMQKAVSYCHDLIEDGRATYEELRELDEGLAMFVLQLTHKEGQDYFKYIGSINGLAKIVKIADIVANLSDSPSEKQIQKYYDALIILTNKE
jgi:hypothetical protein